MAVGPGPVASPASVHDSSLKHNNRDFSFRMTLTRLPYGATRAPRPNRVVGCVYAYEGTEYERALTEPKIGYALYRQVVGATSCHATKPRAVHLVSRFPLGSIESQSCQQWRKVTGSLVKLIQQIARRSDAHSRR